jgi:hypothetical protein
MVADIYSARSRPVSRPYHKPAARLHNGKGRYIQIVILRVTGTYSRANISEDGYMMHMMHTQPAGALGGPSRGFVFTWRLTQRCARHGGKAPGTRRRAAQRCSALLSMCQRQPSESHDKGHGCNSSQLCCGRRFRLVGLSCELDRMH